ncbi:hypothetical protein BJ741DRAFT_53558 [Chytriomyces cf. hyalinus JEL632]|nr:hypothetical protein BJ741DRAFT_53558 [Chytriomyces cf. hyalinus JEL632]
MSPRVAQHPSWRDHLNSSIIVPGHTDAPLGSKKEIKSQRIAWEPASSKSSRPVIAVSADLFSCPDPFPGKRNAYCRSSAQTESLESNPALPACATIDKLPHHVSPLLLQAADLISSNLSSATANAQLLLPILDTVSTHVNPTRLTQKSPSIHFLRYSAVCILVQKEIISAENGFLDPIFHLLDFDAMSISELEAIGLHDVVPVSILMNALMHRVKLHANVHPDQQELVDPLNACSGVFNDDFDLVEGISIPETASASKAVLPELVEDIHLFRNVSATESGLPSVAAVPENDAAFTDENSDSGSEQKSLNEFKPDDDEMDVAEKRGRSRLRTFGRRKRVSAVIQPIRAETRKERKCIKPPKHFNEEILENDANFSVDINELLEATRPVFIELRPLNGCKPTAGSIDCKIDVTDSLLSSQETAAEIPPLIFPTSARRGFSPVLEFNQPVAFNESFALNTSRMSSSSYDVFAASASPAAEMASHDESAISLQESTGILEGSLDLEYLPPASPDADESNPAIALEPIKFKEPISGDYWDEESHLESMHPTQMSTLKLLDSVNDKLFKILAEERDEMPVLANRIFSKVNALDEQGPQESPIQSTNRLRERALRGVSPRLKQKSSSRFFSKPHISYNGNNVRDDRFKGALPATVEMPKRKAAQETIPHKEMEQRWLSDQEALFVNNCKVSRSVAHFDTTRGPVFDKKKSNRTGQKEPWQSAFSSGALSSSFLKGPPPRVNRMERRASLQLMMQQPNLDINRQVHLTPSRCTQQPSGVISGQGVLDGYVRNQNESADYNRTSSKIHESCRCGLCLNNVGFASPALNSRGSDSSGGIFTGGSPFFVETQQMSTSTVRGSFIRRQGSRAECAPILLHRGGEVWRRGRLDDIGWREGPSRDDGARDRRQCSTLH